MTPGGSMLIVNPTRDGAPHWTDIPAQLTIAGRPVEAETPPYKVQGYSVQVVSIQSESGDGVLALVEDEAALEAVAASIGAPQRRTSLPVVVAVRGAEPAPIRRALAETDSGPRPRSLIRFGAVPRPAWDQRFFQPVIDAEARRGNPGGLYFGDTRDDGCALLFQGPLDGKALAAEFELDDGMRLERAENPLIRYSTPDGATAWVLVGRPISVSSSMRARRDAWWHEWNAKPRPLITLHNPFVHPDALPPLPSNRPVILGEAPAGMVLGDEMSSELPGLGRGWSVWPFTSDDGPGLLAVSPYVRQPEASVPEVLNAGGASVPVLIAIRGRESPAVAAAMKAAQVEVRWPL